MYLYTKMKKMKAFKWRGSQQHTHYNSRELREGCGGGMEGVWHAT